MAEQDKEGSAAGGSEKCRKCEPEPKTSTDSIDHKTARFIADAAALCSASVIVFEHPDRNGSKAQRKKAASPESAAVQRIVAGKAHRAGVRNTSPPSFLSLRQSRAGQNQLLHVYVRKMRGHREGRQTEACCPVRLGRHGLCGYCSGGMTGDGGCSSPQKNGV